MAYSAMQVAMVCWNEGIHDEPTMTRAVAIAMAESGGDPNAHNTKGLDDSYGLWQINMLGAKGPERRKALGLKSNTELYKPEINAKAMTLVSNHWRNWTPWSVFTTGDYTAHVSEAKAASVEVIRRANAASPNPLSYIFPGVNVPDINVPNPIGGVQATIANSVNGLMQSFMKIGANAFAVGISLVLLVIGVVILLRQPLANAAKKTASVAGSTTAVGKAAGVASKVVS